MLINKPYEIDFEFKDKGHIGVMNVRYDRRTERTKDSLLTYPCELRLRGGGLWIMLF